MTYLQLSRFLSAFARLPKPAKAGRSVIRFAREEDSLLNQKDMDPIFRYAIVPFMDHGGENDPYTNIVAPHVGMFLNRLIASKKFDGSSISDNSKDLARTILQTGDYHGLRPLHDALMDDGINIDNYADLTHLPHHIEADQNHLKHLTYYAGLSGQDFRSPVHNALDLHAENGHPPHDALRYSFEDFAANAPEAYEYMGGLPDKTLHRLTYPMFDWSRQSAGTLEDTAHRLGEVYPTAEEHLGREGHERMIRSSTAAFPIRFAGRRDTRFFRPLDKPATVAGGAPRHPDDIAADEERERARQAEETQRLAQDALTSESPELPQVSPAGELKSETLPDLKPISLRHFSYIPAEPRSLEHAGTSPRSPHKPPTTKVKVSYEPAFAALHNDKLLIRRRPENWDPEKHPDKYGDLWIDEEHHLSEVPSHSPDFRDFIVQHHRSYRNDPGKEPELIEENPSAREHLIRVHRGDKTGYSDSSSSPGSTGDMENVGSPEKPIYKTFFGHGHDKMQDALGQLVRGDMLQDRHAHQDLDKADNGAGDIFKPLPQVDPDPYTLPAKSRSGARTNPTIRDINRGVDELIAGTRLAYHLKQIGKQYQNDPEIPRAAEEALRGNWHSKYVGRDVFSRIGKLLKDRGDTKFVDAYRWDKVSEGLKLDRAVKLYVERNLQGGQKEIHRKLARILAPGGKIGTTAGWQKFWDGLRGLGRQLGLRGKLTNEMLRRSLLREAFRTEDRQAIEGAMVSGPNRQKDIPLPSQGLHPETGRVLPGGTHHTWRNLYGFLPAIIGRKSEPRNPERFKRDAAIFRFAMEEEGCRHPYADDPEPFQHPLLNASDRRRVWQRTGLTGHPEYAIQPVRDLNGPLREAHQQVLKNPLSSEAHSNYAELLRNAQERILDHFRVRFNDGRRSPPTKETHDLLNDVTERGEWHDHLNRALYHHGYERNDPVLEHSLRAIHQNSRDVDSRLMLANYLEEVKAPQDAQNGHEWTNLAEVIRLDHAIAQLEESGEPVPPELADRFRSATSSIGSFAKKHGFNFFKKLSDFAHKQAPNNLNEFGPRRYAKKAVQKPIRFVRPTMPPQKSNHPDVPSIYKQMHAFLGKRTQRRLAKNKVMYRNGTDIVVALHGEKPFEGHPKHTAIIAHPDDTFTLQHADWASSTANRMIRNYTPAYTHVYRGQPTIFHVDHGRRPFFDGLRVDQFGRDITTLVPHPEAAKNMMVQAAKGGPEGVAARMALDDYIIENGVASEESQRTRPQEHAEQMKRAAQSQSIKFTQSGWPSTSSDFGQALMRLRSANHLAYVKALHSTFNAMALDPHQIVPVLHDTALATQPTFAVGISKPVDPASAAYSAAWLGLLSRQSGVLIFSSADDGPDSLYHMTVPGSIGGTALRGVLDQYQIPQRTIVPDKKGDGMNVIIHDPQRQLRNQVGMMANQLGVSVGETTGTGKVVGGAEPGTARAAYRKIVDDFENQATQAQDVGRPEQSEMQ